MTSWLTPSLMYSADSATATKGALGSTLVADDIEARLAGRLRALREERKLTLSALGQRTGISSAHLSRLETGERQPSIGALVELGRAYGLSVSALIGDEQPRHRVLRRAEVVAHTHPGGSYRLLSDTAALSIFELLLDAGGCSIASQHAGAEWLRVERGKVELTLGPEVLALSGGDVVEFDSTMTHALTNMGRGEARVLIVATSPAMAHHALS